MSADIVLFFGAGASTVEPYNYPVTNKFFEYAEKMRLWGPKNIGVGEMWNISAFTWDDGQHPLYGRDIEVLMGVLEKLEALGEKDQYFGNALNGCLERSSGFHGGLSKICNHAAEARRQLQNWVLKVYGGAKEKGVSLWHKKIIGDIIAWGKDYNIEKLIPIFTVNYDQIIEIVCEDLHETFLHEDAFRESGEWYNMMLRNPTDSYLVQLYKLHGSIDWLQHRGKVARMPAEVLLEDPNKHALLYPGFKSIPQHIPFGHHHDMLDQALSTAVCCLIIGFAFRDEYINRIFEKAMANRASDTPSLTLIVINPDKELLEKPPLSSWVKIYGIERLIHLPFKFGPDAVQPYRNELIKVLSKIKPKIKPNSQIDIIQMDIAKKSSWSLKRILEESSLAEAFEDERRSAICLSKSIDYGQDLVEFLEKKRELPLPFKIHQKLSEAIDKTEHLIKTLLETQSQKHFNKKADSFTFLRREIDQLHDYFATFRFDP